MFAINEILLIIGAYLVGSIPTGYIIGKIKSVDITKEGSGNIGMANVFRILGFKYAIIVLLIDILKGFIPTFIAIKMGFKTITVLLVGLFAVLGHIFTIFLKFKGGKGVATSLGVILAISPFIGISSFLVWFLTVMISRYSSLGSIFASLWALTIVLLYQFNTLNFQIFNIHFERKFLITIFTFFLCFFIIYKHKDNIKRIMKNQENKMF